MRKRIIVYFILISCFRSKAQNGNYFIQNFTSSQGLEEQIIYNATQDEYGQMWFATIHGLYGFDNKYFKKYSPDFQTPGRDLNNILYGLYYDKQIKKLWCASKDLILWFDPITKQFSTPKIESKALSELADNQSFIIHRCKNGRLLFGTSYKGLAYFDSKTNSIQYVLHQNSHIPAITKIADINDNTCIILTNNGLFFLNTTEMVLTKYSNTIYNYYSDVSLNIKDSMLWLSTPAQGIFSFHMQSKTFKQYPYKSFYKGKFLNNGIFWSLAKLNDDELLTGNLIFNIKSREYRDFEAQNELYKNQSNHIEKYVIDIEKNIWACSYTGLSLISSQNGFVQNHPITNPQNEFSMELVQPILAQKNIWFWNRELPHIYSYNVESKKTVKLNFHDNIYPSIFCNLKIAENKIWFATNMGIFELNTENSTIKKIILPMDVNAQNNIIYLYMDASRNVWATVRNRGLFVWRQLNELSFKQVIEFSKIPNNKNLTYIDGATDDLKGNVWCFSELGLFKINKNSLEFKNYFGKIDPSANPIGAVYDIQCDKNNHIWFTDYISGLSELYEEKNKINLVNHSNKQSNSFVSSFCSDLTMDNAGNLWIGSSSGLIYFNPNTKEKIAQLGIEFGFKHSSFEREIFIDQNYLFITNWSSFDIADLTKWKLNMFKPQIVLTNILLGNKKINYLDNTQIHLPYNEASLLMDVGCTGYNHGNQNQIFYQLIGAEKSAQKLGNNYRIQYTGLAPGNYQLKIWVLNNNGIKGEEKIINIHIHPPFYKTWWFIMLCLLVLTASIYFFYRIKLQSAKKEAAIEANFKQQIAESEMKALRAQMNPHFMFNAMNSIQKFILKNETQQASQYLTKFSRLIRLILEQSATKTVSIQAEIELLNLYTDLEKMRFDKAFTFEIEIDNKLDIAKTQIPTMLLQPFVENAIWHGLLHKDGVGNIIVNFNKNTTTNILQISVTDNGIGREKALEHKSKTALKNKSFGMDITANRLQLLNKNGTYEITDLVENGIACGTKINIEIPLELS